MQADQYQSNNIDILSRLYKARMPVYLVFVGYQRHHPLYMQLINYFKMTSEIEGSTLIWSNCQKRIFMIKFVSKYMGCIPADIICTKSAIQEKRNIKQLNGRAKIIEDRGVDYLLELFEYF